jgi:anti-sigma factor RsiW
MSEHLTNDEPLWCERIDSYFDGELTAQDAARFELHLSCCARCRAAVDQQRWLDELLQSDDAALLEMAPAMICMNRRQKRPILWWKAVAAILAVAGGLALLQAKRGPRVLPRAVPLAGPAQNAIDDSIIDTSFKETPATFAASDSPAVFVSTGRDIAMPVESRSADVTIVRLYSTVGNRVERSAVSHITPPRGEGDEL